jgi:large subunit ribosomal protein L23
MAKTTTNKMGFAYRLTEKSNRLSEQSVFVLNVNKNANKTEIIRELKKTYKVTPLAVRIINTVKKMKMRQTGPSMHGGGKKAYITLKKGETITL